MDLHYLVEIKDPKNHYVSVKISGKRAQNTSLLQFFLPVWSPGSYFVREYSRNIRGLKVSSGLGEHLFFRSLSKNTWEIDWGHTPVKDQENFLLEYEVYCHEMGVRNSYIDDSHAFLHGPTYLMGIKNHAFTPTLTLRFPPSWSKVSTSLKDISAQRQEFKYLASNYDELIDTPIELGCHETDGFQIKGVDHHLAIYGHTLEPLQSFKADTKKVTESVVSIFGEIPFSEYTFIIHLMPGIYGGLEHLNNSVIQFDSLCLGKREDYIRFLSLIAHEYFHSWNVKRIRPIELGPFNYDQENYTTLHWLTEGLTSFVDDWICRVSGVSKDEDYLGVIKDSFNKVLSTPGRKFHSLEDSSFNAWIKLYKPDENSQNSSISYYLKGGVVFMILHADLCAENQSVIQFLRSLWSMYKKNPESGLIHEEVVAEVAKISSPQTYQRFINGITTTEELDFHQTLEKMGVEATWVQNPDLGIIFENQDGNLVCAQIRLDGAAYKSGLNAGDEILFLNAQRIRFKDKDSLVNWLKPDQSYSALINRKGRMVETSLVLGQSPPLIKELKIKDRKRWEQFFQMLPIPS